jgi:hypothetical protein
MPAQPKQLAFPASTPTVPIVASAIAANEVFSTLHLAGDVTFVASTAANSAKSSLQPGLFARRLRTRKDLDDQDIEKIQRIIERDGFQVY